MKTKLIQIDDQIMKDMNDLAKSYEMPLNKYIQKVFAWHTMQSIPRLENYRDMKNALNKK